MNRHLLYCYTCSQKLLNPIGGDCGGCKAAYANMALVHGNEEPEIHTPDRQKAVAATMERVRAELARLDSKKVKLPGITSTARKKRLRRASLATARRAS